MVDETIMPNKKSPSNVYDVFDDAEFTKAISNVDKLITSLPIESSNSGFSDNLVSQALKEALHTSSGEKIDNIDELFSNVDVSQARLSRYNTYDQIHNSVQLIKKILRTYLTNIVQADPISGKSIIIKESENYKNDNLSKTYKKFALDVIDYFNLEQKLKDIIVPNQLKYGDAFIEIIDLEKIKIDFPKNKKGIKDKTEVSKIQQIYETVAYQKLVNKSDNEYKNLNFDDVTELLSEFVEYDDEPVLMEEKEENISNETLFSRILLKFHTPHNIIVMMSDYDSVLGYLEVREVLKKVDGTISTPLAQFVNLVNQMSATNSIIGLTKDERTENTVEMFSKAIVGKILDNKKIYYNNNDKLYNTEIKNKLEPEIYHILKRLLITSDKNHLFKNKIRIRYIEPNNMFQFRVSSGTYWPYGTSMLDSLIYPAKLYLLTQLSNCVSKLSRSSLIRKWTLETGSRKDTASLLQKLKKNLRNQRTTAADLLSAKEIPQILSDYKDMITFKKKGQTFIDLDISQIGDPSIGIRDLEDIRNELIAISGVPGIYLGYQDQAEIRDKLANLNIIFATEISSLQSEINNNITKMVSRISDILEVQKDEKLHKYIKLTLIPPTILTLQLIEATLTSISDIQKLLAEMPDINSDPKYLLQRFVSFINWDEFFSESNAFKQKLQLRQSPDQQNAVGGVPGY